MISKHFWLWRPSLDQNIAAIVYEHQILSHHEGNGGSDSRDRGEAVVCGQVRGGLAVFIPYPVHDVKLTAESLDGTANLQQLEPQGIVYGQTGRHSVGEVWQKPDRRERKRWKEGRKEGTKKTNRQSYVRMCVRVCNPSVIHWTEADLRRS